MYLDFVCLPGIRLDCARCTAPEISYNRGSHHGFIQNSKVVPITACPLRYDDSFYSS